jgi:hypothetical protein
MSLPPLRNAPVPAATPQARPAAEVRNAQRAFFEAALGRAGAPEQKTAKAGPPPQVDVSKVETQRYARPGSVLDIKV